MGKDANRIKAIIEYCGKIEYAVEEFGNDIENFLDDYVYHDVCCFYLFQIGENAGFLSPEIKKKYDDVSWDNMMETRNAVAHGYGGIDLEAAWTSITKRVPKIKKTCEKILRELKN